MIMSAHDRSRKAARARHRTERKTARDRRRHDRAAGRLDPSLTATPDDTGDKSNLMPIQQLRRRRTFELLEQACSDLVAVRQKRVLELVSAPAGSDEHSQLSQEVEVLDDEIDDLRELSDELLRRVAPLEIADDRLAHLEQMLSDAQALANASARAQALVGAAQELLATIDSAIEDS
jgi:hypothetical protein